MCAARLTDIDGKHRGIDVWIRRRRSLPRRVERQKKKWVGGLKERAASSSIGKDESRIEVCLSERKVGDKVGLRVKKNICWPREERHK